MKNKKIIGLLAALTLMFILQACRQNEGELVSTSEDNNTMTSISVEENIESTKESVEENQAVSKKPVEEKEEDVENKDFESKDGIYVTSLIGELKGEPMEISEQGTIYNMIIEDDKLILDGSVNYRKNYEDIDNQDLLENKNYKFKLDENTSYSLVGGMAPEEFLEVDQFNKYYEEVKESGLALIIEVEDGLVKAVRISS